MYLFILESIGTSELILIGLVALIVFGPRKLPEIARTFGKFMAEFRRSTDDFKKTWEREAGVAEEYFSEFRPNSLLENPKVAENTISKDQKIEEISAAVPEIKELNQEKFLEKAIEKQVSNPEIKTTSEKRDWL